MENDVQIFDNPEFGKVRVVMKDDKPWLVGKDVATALGYKEPEKAVREHVPDKFKGVSVLDTPGGKQNVVVINEAGMYKLVMRSKLESAEKFSDWVCEDVLVSIRKTGSYSIAPDKTTSEFAFEREKLAFECEQLAAEREKLAFECEQLAAERKKLAFECEQLAAEREKLAVEREILIVEREILAAERDKFAIRRKKFNFENSKYAKIFALAQLLRDLAKEAGDEK